MQTPPTVDGKVSPEPTPHAPAVVPQRSTRRATARRASDRRATARQYKDDIDGRIVGYVKEHPQGTTGDMAKGLNAEHGEIRRAHQGTGAAHTLSERVTSAGCAFFRSPAFLAATSEGSQGQDHPGIAPI